MVKEIKQKMDDADDKLDINEDSSQAEVAEDCDMKTLNYKMNALLQKVDSID